MRKARGLTQGALAKLVGGIGTATVVRLERSQGNLSQLQRCLDALDIVVELRNQAGNLTLGDKIAKLRCTRRVSQRTLAELSGCSIPTIRALEATKPVGRVATLQAVLTSLGAGAYLRPASEAVPFFRAAGTSRGDQTWETPIELLVKLRAAVGGFALDPCSPTRVSHRVGAKVAYTQDDDGLQLPWATGANGALGIAFMNPPFGQLGLWLKKAVAEVAAKSCGAVVGLIPSRTDTAAWHTFVAPFATVFLLRGRLKYGDGSAAAPFPSCVVIWSIPELRDDLVQRIAVALPDAWCINR